MDEVTWAALTTVLTVIGGVWTWHAFRHRGVASGLRGAAFTLLPPAAYLTGTLEMFTEIGTSVAGWATSLVLNPLVWAGIALAGLSVVLFGTSAALRERGRGGAPASGAAARDEPAGLPRPQQSRGEPMIDEDLSDIEALLKRRGIT